MRKLNNKQLITDEKVTNFKMFKAKKKWIFASALMLSMMSAGMMGTYDAHADVVNPDTVKVVDKGAGPASEAATASVQSASVSEATTSASSSAASSSSADVQGRKANKAEVASSAAPKSEAASQAPSAATKASSSATSASSNKQSSAASSASTDLSGVADNIGSTASAGAKDDLAKSPLANGSASKTADQAKKTDTNKKKQSDAELQAILKEMAAKNPELRAGVEVLANGTLTTSGTGADGLDKDSNGNYTGIITLNYNGTSFGIQIVEGSKFVIGIPAELQALFASPNFKQYISGSFEYSTFGGIFGDSWNYTQNDIEIAADGSTVTFNNKNTFEIGNKEINVTISINLGRAVNDTGMKIPVSNSNYLFDSALLEGDSIIDWNVIGDYNAQATLQTNNLMPDEQTGLESPYVVQPITDADTQVTGTAVPGADVTVWNATHTQILGTGVANGSGYYNITIPKQPEGTSISVTQTVDGETSDSTVVVIQHAPEAIPRPQVNRPVDGDTVVTGTGSTAGNIITVYDDRGNVIGKDYVTSDGTYSVTLLRPLVEGEIIHVTEGNGRDESPQTNTSVGDEIPAPTINAPHAGDTVVTGTGIPGDQIKVYDVNGNLIGAGVVLSDGTYSASVPALTAGQQISVTQTSSDGRESDHTNATVLPNDVTPKPTINQPKDGATVVTGTGVPGDFISIRDANGNVIGGGTVDVNGNYSITLTRPLVGGETIGAVQIGDAGSSEAATTVVLEATHVDAPTINATKDGQTTVSGTGVPGGIVIIYDANNQILGSAVVDANGRYTANINRALVGGETIYANQTVDGVASDRTSSVVQQGQLPDVAVT